MKGDVAREDWINEARPKSSNRVFKRIQHRPIMLDVARDDWINETHPTSSNNVGCYKRRLNQWNPSNIIQQGFQHCPTMLDDVTREDWINDTRPTSSKKVCQRIQHRLDNNVGWCCKRRLNQWNPSKIIQQDFQTDPLSSNDVGWCCRRRLNQWNLSYTIQQCWMLQEKIESMKPVQHHPTRFSNGPSIVQQCWVKLQENIE